MDWFPFVIALLAILVIREFMLWWSPSTHSAQQTDVGNANGAGVIVEVAQIRDETGSRSAGSNVNEGTPSLKIESSYSPTLPYARKIKPEGQVVTHLERNEHENLQALDRTFVFPSAAGLNHAHDFVFNQSVMYGIHETKEKVLRWLAEYTLAGAEFDARGHVPSCHPGTRIAILENLHKWVDNTQYAHQFLWLHGPAGVGKSTIVQSLAEGLAKTSKLGATLFFSRPNNRDNPAFVFPTLAYQLAVRIPRYKEYLRQKMVEDPKLLEKGMRQQFDILIAEPFTNLGFTRECGTWAILLDGLDECNDEEAQVLIVKLISSFSSQYPTNPLVWLIASRPEACLQLVFASDGVRGSFEEHDVPANSDEGCRDVEKFLRAKFEEIHQNYKDLIPAGSPWPVEQDITKISSTSSGLFALATTVVRYIEDPHMCDPISQLATVVSVTKGLEPGSLSALHAFYTAILDGVPKAMSSMLQLLLGLYTVRGVSAILADDDYVNAGREEFPLVLAATLFGLQQHTVYGALRRLHSVIKVPPPEDSGRRGIKFYHASFPDYLKTVPGKYKCNVELVATKVWWSYFEMLHRGNSTLYQRAISDGRPPIQFAWDSHFADGFLDDLWARGITVITHGLLSECSDPNEFGHTRIPLTEMELQNTFENIDFSALLFRKKQKKLFSRLFDLFEWLASDVPPELVQSDLLKVIPLRDLDLGCIPGEKLAHEFLWTSYPRVRADGFVGPRRPQFYRDISHRGNRRYTDTPLESLHPSWENKTRRVEDLITRLDQLKRHDPATQALMVGRAPERRCVFICVEPQSEEQGAFFYVPYTQ